jgi:hypothetical protein
VLYTWLTRTSLKYIINRDVLYFCHLIPLKVEILSLDHCFHTLPISVHLSDQGKHTLKLIKIVFKRCSYTVLTVILFFFLFE